MSAEFTPTIMPNVFGDLNEPPTYTKEVNDRLNALKNLSVEHRVIESKYTEEIFTLEKKYEALFTEFFDKRAKIISGEYEPNDEECDYESSDEEDDEDEDDKLNKIEEIPSDDEEKNDSEKTNEDETTEDVKDEDVKGIPQFWLTTFQNHVSFQDIIEEHDIEPLGALADVRVHYQKVDIKSRAYCITFTFNENEYFTNKEITITYSFKRNEDGPILEEELQSIKASEIDWKPNKDLRVAVTQKKQKHKGTGKIRVITKKEPQKTFFDFFYPVDLEETEDQEDEDEEDDIERATHHVELGEVIRSTLVPQAILWFTGDALDNDGFELEDLLGEDFDDLDDDDDPDFDPSQVEGAPQCPQQ